MNFRRVVFLLVVGLMMGVAVNYQVVAQRQPVVTALPIHLEASPLSLAEMVKFSEKIFFGTVLSVNKGQYYGQELIKILFEITQNIKGDDSTAEVYQDPMLYSKVRVGEKVLWFLSGESKEHLSLPVGFTSGDFRLAKVLPPAV